METRMLYLHALSSLHTGTGQGTGIIDLPVAREVTTGWPYLPGSTVKGVLRDACDPGNDNGRGKTFIDAFGPELGESEIESAAGALWFADARILCLPVRSLHGTFAWVTCPLALSRWRRDHNSRNAEQPIPTVKNGHILVTENTAIIAHTKNAATVYLDELDLVADESPDATQLAKTIGDAVFDDQSWRSIYQQRFGIVSDDVFSFLSKSATEVIARIRLNDQQKTVADGALWYEEAVPAESIFACPIVAAPRTATASASELYDVLIPAFHNPIQIGGKAGTGRGLTELRMKGMES